MAVICYLRVTSLSKNTDYASEIIMGNLGIYLDNILSVSIMSLF